MRDISWSVPACANKSAEHFHSFILGGVLLITEGNLEMQNEHKVGIEPAFGEGGPGQSWLARACFGTFKAVTAAFEELILSRVMQKRTIA